MQCADIFFLRADICQLGLDQRKARRARRGAGWGGAGRAALARAPPALPLALRSPDARQRPRAPGAC